jgi:hypothetical protein
MKSLLFTAILSLRKRSEQLLVKFAILLQVRLTHAQTFFRGVTIHWHATGGKMFWACAKTARPIDKTHIWAETSFSAMLQRRILDCDSRMRQEANCGLQCFVFNVFKNLLFFLLHCSTRGSSAKSVFSLFSTKLAGKKAPAIKFDQRGQFSHLFWHAHLFSHLHCNFQFFVSQSLVSHFLAHKFYEEHQSVN